FTEVSGCPRQAVTGKKHVEPLLGMVAQRANGAVLGEGLDIVAARSVIAGPLLLHADAMRTLVAKGICGRLSSIHNDASPVSVDMGRALGGSSLLALVMSGLWHRTPAHASAGLA